MACSCCFSSGENLDFPDFPQKSFITATSGLAKNRQNFKPSENIFFEKSIAYDLTRTEYIYSPKWPLCQVPTKTSNYL